MSENTNIEWTDHTFNPWSGCAKVSPGCANCYAANLPPSMRRGAVWGEVVGGAAVTRTEAEYAAVLADLLIRPAGRGDRDVGVIGCGAWAPPLRGPSAGLGRVTPHDRERKVSPRLLCGGAVPDHQARQSYHVPARRSW